MQLCMMLQKYSWSKINTSSSFKRYSGGGLYDSSCPIKNVKGDITQAIYSLHTSNEIPNI